MKIPENALNPYLAGLSQKIWRVFASVWPLITTTESLFSSEGDLVGMWLGLNAVRDLYGTMKFV